MISTESSDISNRPTIAADSSGNLHLAWRDHTNYKGSGIDRDVFYKNKIFIIPPKFPLVVIKIIIGAIAGGIVGAFIFVKYKRSRKNAQKQRSEVKSKTIPEVQRNYHLISFIH